MRWRCRDRAFDLADRALVMGVLNVTPDSFSDGARYFHPDAAIARAKELLAEGADLIDVGAESTRPGSQPVPAEGQWRRLEPVLRELAKQPEICLSVDTTRAEVAARALDLGVRVINDVSALADPDMAKRVADAGAGAVLMHMRGTPADMQHDPSYRDAARQVRDWLGERLEWASGADIAHECLAVDPGIGFGKGLDHNLELIARLDEIAALDRPVVVGVSRKSFIGRLLDAPVDQRIEGGLAAAAIAVFLGATIVRVHDVAVTRRAVAIASAIRGAKRREATEA